MCVVGMLLTTGCMVVRSGREDHSTGSKRFGRESGSGQASVRPQDYQSTGSGTPEKREVPGLIIATDVAPAETRSETQEDKTVFPTSGKVYRLKRNDGVAIYLRGIPREDQIEVVVGENGYISLPFLEPIYAADKTASELEHAIRDAYIDGKIYRSVTVNVMIPTQSYFIRGEVQRPSRYPLVPGTTILQALATAGGYSEFANARKIKVLRGDAFFFVDAKELEARPELDREVEAGDVIVVPRSVF
ncbi:MAG: polysaccharide biosynthesis/export family protein [Kiritimatiellae bacterium]|nr:polysaccharide biosynthesis/export family protein [Kiritimatiellia bacterium]